MRLLLIVIGLFYNFAALADLKVTSYDSERKRVEFSGPAEDFQALNPGFKVTIFFENHRTCNVEIIEKTKTKLKADATLCPQSSMIKEGLLAKKTNFDGDTPPPAQAEPAKPEAQPAHEKKETPKSNYSFNWDIGAYYSSADKVEVKGKYRLSGASTEIVIDTEPAFGLLFGFTYFKDVDLNWFISGALSIDFARKFKKAKETKNGTVSYVDYSGNEPSMATVGMYGNFNYLFTDSFYGLIGLGYTSAAITGYYPEIETKAGSQFQLGLGWAIDRTYYAELWYRAQAISAERYIGSGETVEFESMVLSGAVASLRYSFR